MKTKQRNNPIALRDKKQPNKPASQMRRENLRDAKKKAPVEKRLVDVDIEASKDGESCSQYCRRARRGYRDGVRDRVFRYDLEDARRGGASSRPARHRDHSGVRRQALMAAPRPTKPHDGSSPLVITDPKSPAAEAYRTLRTNIQFAGLDQPCRIIAITSATSGEGKSTTVANFGVVVAQAG